MSLRRIVVIGVLALIVLLFFNGGAFIFAEDVQAPKSGPDSGFGGDGGPQFAPAGTRSRSTGCTSVESAWALVVWRSKPCAFPLLPFGGASGPTEV